MRERRCAIYGRYSYDTQSPTSIDDQFRRCRELGVRNNIDVESAIEFRDEEISGFSSKAASRPGYLALMKAWGERKFDVLLVDELSRLARNPRQQLELYELLENTSVRMISANGIDTNQPQWPLLMGIQGLMAQEESRGTSFRVKRGMLGQLQRGFMIAAPAFGYRGERVIGDGGREIGTRWLIDNVKAEIVREMYERRSSGKSFDNIARWLNESGVRPSLRGRIWRAAAVSRILENTIYRGAFVWNGSNFSKHRAKKKGVTLVEEHFARPELRIVSDSMWSSAQPKKISRTGYGGGRNQFSGIIQCGHKGCRAVLSSSSGGECMSCGSCGANHRAGDPDAPVYTPSISIAGLTEVVKFALRYVFDEVRLCELKARLRAQLDAGPDAELARLAGCRDKAARELKQLINLIRKSDGVDALLDEEYKDARSEHKRAELALSEFEVANRDWSPRDIEAQLHVDAGSLAGKLLDGRLPVEKVRTALAQIFPNFVFIGRESRYISRFKLEFAPGAAVAWLSSTDSKLEQRVIMRIRLEASRKRPVDWTVSCEDVYTEDADTPV